MSAENILEITDLKKWYEPERGLLSPAASPLKAVDGVSLTVRRGESVGLVGESGCGKSTLAKVALRLKEPTSGRIVFDGQDITNLKQGELRKFRANMQIVFQDPFSSLNPRMRAGDIVAEPLKIHRICAGIELERTVDRMFERVGLKTAHKKRHPHEFSGGQRQRIMIAKALILNPKMLFCDEPVSALDVSIRSEILNLFVDLKKEFNLTMLFISHDLTVVEYICQRVVVMYLGKIVEIADRETIYKTPRHPYTQALLSSIPMPDPTRKSERIILKGDIPSSRNPPQGCRFRNRCWLAGDACLKDQELRTVGVNHQVACHLAKGLV